MKLFLCSAALLFRVVSKSQPVSFSVPTTSFNGLQMVYTASTYNPVAITIIDIIVKVLTLFQLTGDGQQQSLDINSLSTGMYIYRITEGKMSKMQGKLIKE